MQLGFLLWAVGVIAGTLSAPWLQPEMPLLFITIAIFSYVAVVGGCGLFHKSTQSYLLLGVLCGIWWALFHVQSIHAWTLPASQWREPSTIILQVTEISYNQTRRARVQGCIQVAPVEWQLPNASCASKARLYWYGDERPLELPKPGERWALQVRARPASGMLNDGGYDYQSYLLRHKLFVTGSIRAGTRLAETPKWHWQYWRVRVYQAFAQHRDTIDSLDILLALALGERHWMQPERWQALQRTGLSHLMAISGLHLTLVFAGAWVFLRYLAVACARGLQVFLGCTHTFALTPYAATGAWLVAVAYAALAGFSVSTIRALLLISLFVLSRLVQQRLQPIYLLVYAVLLVLMLDPFAWMDVGFWLSAGAVLAIFSWHWRRDGRAKGTLWRFEWMLLFALAPLSFAFFQGLAWLAPVTNIVVIPLFSVLILPALLVSLVPVLFNLSAYALIWRSLDLVLTPLLNGVDWLANVPGVWLSGTHPWPIMYFFALLIAWLWPGRAIARLFMVSVALLLLFPLFSRPAPAAFALHVLDVGQGTAVVVQRHHHAMLVDVGPAYEGGLDTGASVVVPFLRYHGLTPDWLVLSHAHMDHVGGKQAAQQAYPTLRTMGSGIGERACKMGQQWIWQGVRVRILAPMPGPTYGVNNASCVVLLEFQGQRILLPGDSEWENELRLTGRYQQGLTADLLLVPHHGGKSSSTAAFLEQVNPSIAVVSRGFANQFGMPSMEVKQRYENQGVHLLDTAKGGQISLIWHPERGWSVQQKRGGGEPLRYRRWYYRVPEE
ncbi:DNA internalization-related competence protein ComEC/Rec2 [Aliidiomarina taiwanensis]|uniref:DNA internalization-related competence protein ComEC/Rec2 n=1 Tax=Aliidiomarina taiwanensis TaxID=946228 RepID=A0A432XAE8_9GAMM|nr:DNA internalization-related competence protein ComEC/Rec2 [Aliidiomarina taiwanensis]RUO44392.1 DNA internalization-related competence protein ComEC/Rec2 [Aliidiomarina taiwanensis]